MQKIPKAITNGDNTSFKVANVGLTLGPSCCLSVEYILNVRNASMPIAKNVCHYMNVCVWVLNFGCLIYWWNMPKRGVSTQGIYERQD